MAFGIARDIIGGSSVELNIEAGSTVQDLKRQLLNNYPRFEQLTSLRIALNESYASDDQTISVDDEIVLIPPVCGG